MPVLVITLLKFSDNISDNISNFSDNIIKVSSNVLINFCHFKQAAETKCCKKVCVLVFYVVLKVSSVVADTEKMRKYKTAGF